MKEDQVQLSRKQCIEPYNRAIEVLLTILLTFMPLVFGVVYAWSEEIVLALTVTITIIFVLRQIFVRDIEFIWSWAYIPIGAFIFVVLFQLIPLPAGFVSLISPHTVKLRQDLLGDLPHAEQYLRTMTLSLYPHATWHDLRIITALAMIFIVVLNVYRQPRQIKRLLAAITIIGALVALLAISQDLLGNGKIYWFIKLPRDYPDFSGPFVNHSHYGQFMNLSIGAALGLALLMIHERFGGRNITASKVGEYLSSSRARPLWLLVAYMILGWVTIFLSLTRGGMISLLIATAFTTLLLSSHQSVKGRGWIMAFLALGAFICVLYVGFDAVYERFATLTNFDKAQEGRWQIIKNTTNAWTHFPLFGSGLGTYAVIYPSFDNATNARLASHAENEYVQMLVETGIVGLLTGLVFLVMIVNRYLHNIRRHSDPICLVSYGLGFGLIAILVHSASDFGQHLPANAALSAIFCALLLSISGIDRVRQDATEARVVLGRPSRRIGAIRILLLIGLCIVGGGMLYFADRARCGEAHWREAQNSKNKLMENNWQGNNAEYVYLLSQAGTAAKYQPTNIEYQHWLNVFRWYSISRLKDPNTGDVLLLPETIKFAEQIVSELHRARLLCPTFGPTYCVAGQIEKWALDRPCGERHIRQGYQLAPYDPTVCLTMGILEAQQDKADESFRLLSRTVQLDGQLFKEAAAVCIRRLKRPDMALNLADDSTGRLSTLVYLLNEDEENKVIVEHVHDQIRELLEKDCNEPDAPASVYASLAYIYIKEGRKEEAIGHYRQALALDYGMVNWHYGLAKALADVGAISDAIHEAKICLRLRPSYTPAKKLIMDLSVRAEAFEHRDTP